MEYGDKLSRDRVWMKYLGTALLFVLFILFPFVHSNSYILHIVLLCIIWSVVASAWNLILGYAGIFSFGQLAFFTIGAYTVGILHKFFNISPWIGMIFAGIFPAVVGGIVGIVCLRLRGIYVVLITLVLQEIVPIFINWQAKFTGGAVGFTDMPSLSLASYSLQSRVLFYYLIACMIATLFLFIIYRIIKSPIGLAFVSLRDSEEFAKSLGINEYKYKVLVFIISASITGIMGSLYGLYIGFATPSLCTWDYVAILVIAIFLGGMGKFPGEVIGSFFIIATNEILQGTSEVREAVLGFTIIIVIFLFPGGIINLISTMRIRLQKLFKVYLITSS